MWLILTGSRGMSNYNLAVNSHTGAKKGATLTGRDTLEPDG